MSALPLTLAPRAEEDVRALPADLRPVVLEHLSRVAADYRTCSRQTALPRPPGLESCLWVRRPAGSAHLLEVLFVLTATPAGIRVRRVLLTALDRLPDWASRPTEWSGDTPWPVVDL